MSRQRITQKEPGYDCRAQCQHKKKGDHGIMSDTWWYCVRDGDRAVSLSVYSSDYPATVDRSSLFGSLLCNRPVAITVHRKSSSGTDKACNWLDGQPCEPAMFSLIWADQHFKRFFQHRDAYVQGEDFWKKLESILDEEHTDD